MTKEKLNAIRYLTIGLAKETFKQDYEGFGKEDDDYIKEKLILDSYCEGVEVEVEVRPSIIWTSQFDKEWWNTKWEGEQEDGDDN